MVLHLGLAQAKVVTIVLANGSIMFLLSSGCVVGEHPV